MKKMEQCKRCGRVHGGICGIPAGVTKGYGARRGGSQADYLLQGKPAQSKPSTAILEGMLVWVQKQHKEITSLLKVMPKEMGEYTELLDREGKLAAWIKQLEWQIAGKKTK